MDNIYVTNGILTLIGIVMGYVLGKMSNDGASDASSTELVCLRDDVRALSSQVQSILNKLDQTFIFKKKEEVVKKKK